MNWIRTDIEIGYRIKCFDIDYKILRERFPQFNTTPYFFSIAPLDSMFLALRAENYFPETSKAVRISMPPDKMCIRFWVQDSNFPPIEMGAISEAEYIHLKK